MADFKSPREIDAYRERLQQALLSVLDAATARRAIELWGTAYAATRPYAIIEFVNEVSVALALQTKQRHDLRLALYKTLTGKHIELPKADVLARGPEKATIVPFPGNGAAGAPVAFSVFEAICQHMYDAVIEAGAATPRQIADTLYRTLVVDYDKDLHADAFVRWTAGQNDLKSLVGTTPDIYTLYAEKFHATLRELLGPVLSERLRSHAVAAAERLPAAAHYPPARLLREA